MAEQQASLARRVRGHVHVGGLRGLGVGFLVKGLPGALGLVDVAVGRLAADTLALVETDKEETREEGTMTHRDKDKVTEDNPFS